MAVTHNYFGYWGASWGQSGMEPLTVIWGWGESRSTRSGIRKGLLQMALIRAEWGALES